MRVGICEDDQQLQSVLARALSAEDFEVRVTGDGARCRARVLGRSAGPAGARHRAPGRRRPRRLPGAARTRRRRAVLFLTARGQLTDKLSAFHAGGDDFLTKPFALAELIVRAQALLKRRARVAARAGARPAARPGRVTA